VVLVAGTTLVAVSARDSGVDPAAPSAVRRGGGEGRHQGTGSAPTIRPVSTTTPTTTAPATTTTQPGTLPQTDTLPSADTPQFASQMAALWTGIANDSPSAAMPAFFPEAAYLQLKTITDASGDFEDRLVHDYGLDIAAANALLGPHAADATLVSVNVPSQNVHWIPPGVCDNDVGYFEVANSRIVYQEDGQTRSVGIASLISWRGVWYVVHLGAILRSTDSGVVLDPETGPGSSPASSTC